MPEPDELRPALQAYLTHAFGDRPNVRVSHLTNISSGWESQMHAFRLAYGAAPDRCQEALILRMYPGKDGAAKAAHEFESLKRLRQASYPVPQVFLLEQEKRLQDLPFIIMEKIEGQSLWTLLGKNRPARALRLLDQFCNLQVRLHNLDWRPFVPEMDRKEMPGPYVCIDNWLLEARQALQKFGYLEMMPVVEWVEAHRSQMTCPRPSPVHWDFHPANILVHKNSAGEDTAIVIDWTGFRVTDARFDLAWTLLLTQIYSGTPLRDKILERYQQHAGATVENLSCFEVCACARRLFDVSGMLMHGADQHSMRPEAIAIIRQQMEIHRQVYDMLVQRTGMRILTLEQLFHIA